MHGNHVAHKLFTIITSVKKFRNFYGTKKEDGVRLTNLNERKNDRDAGGELKMKAQFVEENNGIPNVDPVIHPSSLTTEQVKSSGTGKRGKNKKGRGGVEGFETLEFCSFSILVVRLERDRKWCNFWR